MAETREGSSIRTDLKNSAEKVKDAFTDYYGFHLGSCVDHEPRAAAIASVRCPAGDQV
jgi:hypothetical protein